MDNKKEIICVICPNGCVTIVGKDDSDIKISGKYCKRGKDYIVQEYLEPRRIITTTVRITSAVRKMLPVKTSSSILKKDIFTLMDKVKSITAKTPVFVGQVICKDIFAGVDLVSEDEIVE